MRGRRKRKVRFLLSLKGLPTDCVFIRKEKKRYRECFMYGRGMTSEFPGLAKLRLSGGGYKQEQRISVISNASSNTTSGIVSDRVQSLDGSEGKLFIKKVEIQN